MGRVAGSPIDLGCRQPCGSEGIGSPTGQDAGSLMSPWGPGIPTGWECRQPHRSGVAAASLVRGYKLPWGSGKEADPRVKAATDLGGGGACTVSTTCQGV